MADDSAHQTAMDELGVDPYLGAAPIDVRRASQIGMFAALFAASPEAWPVFLAWLDKHAPAHAAMMRDTGTTPKTFQAAANVLAGQDVMLHMLGYCEPGTTGT